MPTKIASPRNFRGNTQQETLQGGRGWTQKAQRKKHCALLII